MVMYLIMRGTPWRTIFDKVNDGSILRQGGSLATNDSPRGTALRTSPTPPLSRSDLVLWHYPVVRCDAAISPQSDVERTYRGFGP